MADFPEGQIVKTKRDNEFRVEIVDGQSGTSATKKLTVAQDGDTDVAGTNDFGVPVMSLTSDNKLRILRSDASGSIYAVIAPPSGTATKTKYADTTVAGGVTTNVDSVALTAGKTITSIKVHVASLGLAKWVIGLFDGVLFTAYGGTVTSPAGPNDDVVLLNMPVAGATDVIRIQVTNEDSTSNNFQTTLSYQEV